jgi:serine/threonine protein kinase
MDTLDLSTLYQRLLQLRLVSEAQLQDAREELQIPNPLPEAVLHILERKGHMTPWQSAKLMKGDTAGFILGGVKLLYKIASGSFGRVFRAEEPGTGRVMAVKVLRRRWSENRQHIDLFLREGKLGQALKHPNIVEVVNAGFDQPSGQYFIVMEFVEGGNLREILAIRQEEQRLTVLEALKIVEDCAAGLVYASTRGMTHRDIKLTNVLVSSSGQAKLVDFGLAQMYENMDEEAEAEDDGKAKKKKKKGEDSEERKIERTVDYAGLERATEVKQGDPRSDIFFLGCVLYQALVNRSPLIMSRDRLSRMQRYRFESVQPIDRAELDAPPSVFSLVETMMAFNPTRRYQTPSQMLEAIKAARRDVEARVSGGQVSRTMFLVERDDRLREALRERFKQLGYRVLIAGDPQRALDRFRQQPFDALIIDVGTTNEEGLGIFQVIMKEAEDRHIPCAGIAVLAEEQAEWARKIEKRTRQAVLVRPITLKQLSRKLQELQAA